MTTLRLPLFVVVEGLDGVGKTTIVQKLERRLSAVVLRTPSRELAGVREAVLNAFADSPLATTLFYAATLASASREIAQLQAAGRAVVLDRYFLSTCVYSEVVRAVDHPGDLLEGLGSRLIPADVTVYLYANRDRRRERMRTRGHIGFEDQLTFDPDISDRLDAGFKARAGHRLAGHFLAIDTTDVGPDESTEQIVQSLAKLGLWPGNQAGLSAPSEGGVK